MPKFKVKVSREWIETAEHIVEAEDEQEAREIIDEMFTRDPEEFNWGKQTRGEDYTDSVEEIK